MVYVSMICLTLLTVGYAVWPLLREEAEIRPKDPADISPSRDDFLSRQMQELELDYASGKLTPEDYRIARMEMQTPGKENQTHHAH